MSSEEPGLKRELVTLVEDTGKELAAILEATHKEELLNRFDAALRVLSQNRGVSEVRVARDKLIVVLETLEFFREQVGPAEQQDLMAVCRACFRELSVSMAVLERAFVEGLDGNKLHKVLKELILKMDNSLMDIKKKNIDLISFGAEDIKREIYSDIEALNKTIEHLKKENQKLRLSLQSFGSGNETQTHGQKSEEPVDSLAGKLYSLEQRIKSSPTDLPVGDRNTKQQSRITELETEQHRLTRQVIDHEEVAKNFKREIEALENAKLKIQNNLDRLIEDHDTLKSRSLDLLKRNAHIEAENDVLRKEKTQLVDNILSLQKSHQDEINGLRSTLENISEKLYVVGLDAENKQTFADLETRHTSEKKSWTERNRNLQETCEQFQKDTSALEAKVEEQHQVISVYQKIEGTLHDEQRKLRSLEAQYERLLESHANLENERDNALSQIRDLERELHQTREDRSKAHGDIGALQRHKEDLTRHKAELEDRHRDLTTIHEDIKEKLVSSESEKRSHERSIQKLKEDSLRNNSMLKRSSEEIVTLQESLSEKRKELDAIDKDRVFLRKKVERLEDQLFQKEKKFLRDEAEREVDSEERVRRLAEENDSLKEEVISRSIANTSIGKGELQTLQ